MVKATTQEVDLLRRQHEELNARMEDIRQQSANAAVECGSDRTQRGCENDGTVGDETAVRVGKPEPNVPGKDFDDWNFTFNGYAGTLDPAYPGLAESGETVHDCGDSYPTTRTGSPRHCCTCSRCSHR